MGLLLVLSICSLNKVFSPKTLKDCSWFLNTFGVKNFPHDTINVTFISTLDECFNKGGKEEKENLKVASIRILASLNPEGLGTIAVHSRVHWVPNASQSLSPS